MPRRLLYILLFLATPMVASAQTADSPSALNLGTHLELFVDDFLIESRDGLQLKLHHHRISQILRRKFDQPPHLTRIVLLARNIPEIHVRIQLS